MQVKKNLEFASSAPLSNSYSLPRIRDTMLMLLVFQGPGLHVGQCYTFRGRF